MRGNVRQIVAGWIDWSWFLGSESLAPVFILPCEPRQDPLAKVIDWKEAKLHTPATSTVVPAVSEVQHFDPFENPLQYDVMPATSYELNVLESGGGC